MKELIPQKGRKALGIILLVTAVFLYLSGYQLSFDPANLGFIVLLLVVAGVALLLFSSMTKRRDKW